MISVLTIGSYQQRDGVQQCTTSKLTQRTLQKQCLSKNDWSRQFFEINAPMGSSSPPNGPQQPSASLASSLKLHLLALLLPLPSNAMRCAHFDAHQHCALVLITWALHGALWWCSDIHRLDNGHYGALTFSLKTFEFH